MVVWGLVLLILAFWRTFRPLSSSARLLSSPARPADPSRRAGRALPFVADIALIASALVTTGYWSSPYALCILTPVVAAGFARGYGFALQLALGASVAVSLPFHLSGAATYPDGLQLVAQSVIELLLVAALAGYARRLFGEAERRHSQTISRLAKLSEANQLLVSLHRLSQQLPASLNLQTALSSTVSRLRSIIESDVCAVLLHDEGSGRWTVAAGEGARIGRSFADGELPAPLATTLSSSVASLVVCLDPGEGLGPEMLSHSGLYAPLRARGSLIGLVAVEHHAPGFYGRRELQLLDRLVEPAALALDNARWFSRLRAAGAEEERLRIARDMHDRLGQSLAGVAFGLDRIRRQVGDQVLVKELDELRAEVRQALGEVRETLGDLRTDISEDRGIIETLASFLARVEARTSLAVNFVHRNGRRLPLVQEREMWRIAQEAVTNVERHARASHLSVRWEHDGDTAVLAVADDGDGFDAGNAGRPDSYGLRGMRERADAIGASFEIDTAPGAGTVVRCRLEQP